MNLNILTLNCNKGYVDGLESFLKLTFAEHKYDFILLQEVRARDHPKLDPLMEGILGNYSLLRAFNSKVNAWSEIIIVYRKNFRLIESQLYSIPPYVRFPEIKLAEFGFLAATFEIEAGKIVIGSVHMHSDIRLITRMQEAKLIKKVLI